MTTNQEPTEQDERQALQVIAAALEGLRFGSVEITVHDSRIIQIDRTEKLRLATQGREGFAGKPAGCQHKKW